MIPADQDPEGGHLLTTTRKGHNLKTHHNYTMMAFWSYDGYVHGYIRFVRDSLQGRRLAEGGQPPGMVLYARGVRASPWGDVQWGP